MDFDGKAFVRTLTHSPGVYRMYDADGQLLYVGKAKDLHKRVGSYFLRVPSDPRIAAMVRRIAQMDITVTRTEAEALILEQQLIDRQRPKYNIQMRDGKGYTSLRVTVGDEFPRLCSHRGESETGRAGADAGGAAPNAPQRARSGGGAPAARDFGPFPSADAVRASISLIQKAFLLRTCEDSYFRHRSRPCLQHAIGRCSAPCVGLISRDDYRVSVDHAVAFLEGKEDTVAHDLQVRMREASDRLDFEAAARWRDQIAHLRAVQARMDVRGSETDRDVIVCRIAGGVAAVCVMAYRHGRSLGARSVFPECPLEADAAEILERFVAGHYLNRAGAVPAELVLDPAPADGEALQAALTERAGRSVAVITHLRGERARQMALAQKNIATALAARAAARSEQDRRRADLVRLLDLPAAPERIECFDISHTRGEATVASCVVFGPHGAEKGLYRRYNISGITPGDDPAAMHQALSRRFGRAVRENGPLPDLLLIDGGEPQVRQAVEVLEGLGLLVLPSAPSGADARPTEHGGGTDTPTTTGITVVGVSKGPDRIPGDEDLVRLGQPALHPGPGSPGLHLIMAVRDEAHRFAITGHRRRRQAARNQSVLETIPGVGPSRRTALLTAFGGWQGVQAAGVEELTRVEGISNALAQRIYDTLHGDG